MEDESTNPAGPGWLPGRPASPGGAARGGARAPAAGRGGMSPAEEEAVRRFQAFVRASGMGEMMGAEDGRMWDYTKAEGPQVGAAHGGF